MEAATWIAIAGLAASTILGVAGPAIQAAFAAKNAAKDRLSVRRLAAYDAMIYVQRVKLRVDDLVTHPDSRSGGQLRASPPTDETSARLRLLSPDLVGTWDALVQEWEILSWNLTNDGPGAHGEFFADAAETQVVKVRTAITALEAALSNAAVANS